MAWCAACNYLIPQAAGEGGEGAGAAATDSTTTDSESVSDLQLVRGGGEQRTLFKLLLQVRHSALLAQKLWHLSQQH